MLHIVCMGEGGGGGGGGGHDPSCSYGCKDCMLGFTHPVRSNGAHPSDLVVWYVTFELQK